MVKRIPYPFCLILFILGMSGFSQKAAQHTGAIRQDVEKAITLSGFPSRDTSSITFYKKDTWFKLVKMQNPLTVTQPEACYTCQEVFTNAFLDNLFALQSEKLPSSGCRILTDTIIDGKKIGSIEDFYRISDLERETITINNGEKASSFSYLEPRYALRYCKDNTNRLAFIRASDRLLKIK